MDIEEVMKELEVRFPNMEFNESPVIKGYIVARYKDTPNCPYIFGNVKDFSRDVSGKLVAEGYGI